MTKAQLTATIKKLNALMQDVEKFGGEADNETYKDCPTCGQEVEDRFAEERRRGLEDALAFLTDADDTLRAIDSYPLS